MPDSIFASIIKILLIWTLLSLGTSVVGLYAKPRDFWRGFWFMSGLWGFIDGVIAVFGLFQEPLPVEELRSILGLNLMLDLGYLAGGVILLFLKKPILKGFGAAVLVQAIYLTILDAYFWQLCGTAVSQ